MKISTRLDNALRKLYDAFHNNTLNPECCKQCAVGNILNHSDSWKYLSDNHGSLELSYVGIVNQKFGKRFAGYTPLELLQIEATFLKGCGYSLPLHHQGERPINPCDKDILFKGLEAVTKLLCYLDDVPNFMNSLQFLKKELNQSMCFSESFFNSKDSNVEIVQD